MAEIEVVTVVASVVIAVASVGNAEDSVAVVVMEVLLKKILKIVLQELLNVVVAETVAVEVLAAITTLHHREEEIVEIGVTEEKDASMIE